MNRLLFCVLYLIFIIKLTYQISTPSSTNYVAAVVEFYPTSYGNAIDTVNNRTDEYIALIGSTEANTVDIIVFPESTLNNRNTAAEIPRPENLIAPCDSNETEYMSFVQKISCAARQYRKYVVINLTMKRNCTEDSLIYNDTRQCPDNDILLYNTNVVFDRNGTVISTYRKYNLFGEAGITVPNTVDISVFDTDFGVQFGHFICFDLLFDTPAIELVNQGIKNIIFPTMWFSELPFLTAAQAQQAWAERFNVNFLAAGASNTAVGSTGSGIYHGKDGSLGTIMAATPITRIIVASIDKNLPTEIDELVAEKLVNIEVKDGVDVKDKSDLVVARDTSNNVNRITDAMLSLLLKTENLGNYSHYFLNFSNSYQSINTTVCSNEGFCCDFETRISTGSSLPNHYRYYAVAFYGNRTFDDVIDGGILSCAVIACTNNSFESCGLRFPEGTNNVTNRYSFLTLKITTTYTSTTFDVPMPSSLNAHIMPFHPHEYKYEEIGNFTHQSPTGVKTISMTLLNPRVDLLTFGIYGRTYPSNWVNSNSTTNYITFSVLLLCILSSIFKFV